MLVYWSVLTQIDPGKYTEPIHQIFNRNTYRFFSCSHWQTTIVYIIKEEFEKPSSI